MESQIVMLYQEKDKLHGTKAHQLSSAMYTLLTCISMRWILKAVIYMMAGK